MLKSEFLERISTGAMEDWQWPVIEEVYTFHKSISDINGKNEIAVIFNEKGFPGIYEMYRELHPCDNPHDIGTSRDSYAVIKAHRTDLYDNYDVSYEGYCINTKNNTLRSLYEYVCKELKENHKELYEQLDYFSMDSGYHLTKEERVKRLIPQFRWIAVFYVTGGSEGHYIHVEAIAEERTENLFLGKTFLGRDHAEKVCNVLSRILNV